MATFYNQASLSFGGTVTNSNITEGELETGLTATKTAISGGYGANDEITYLLTIVNNGQAITDLSVSDNLGAYTPAANPQTTVVPLDYVADSVLLFSNGNPGTAPTVTVGAPLVFSGISIGAGDTVTLIYSARTNEYAPLSEGATIINTATITAPGLLETVTASATITASASASLTIAKAICPSVVSDNGKLTYTFIIQNTGNTTAGVDDEIVITDTFNPILNPITVTINGTDVTDTTAYTYNTATGEFATVAGIITVPPATYTQDATTGVISITPGVTVITVTGTV